MIQNTDLPRVLLHYFVRLLWPRILLTPPPRTLRPTPPALPVLAGRGWRPGAPAAAPPHRQPLDDPPGAEAPRGPHCPGGMPPRPPEGSLRSVLPPGTAWPGSWLVSSLVRVAIGGAEVFHAPSPVIAFLSSAQFCATTNPGRFRPNLGPSNGAAFGCLLAGRDVRTNKNLLC